MAPNLPSKKLKTYEKKKRRHAAKSPCTFEDLPEEIQLLIFSDFSQRELCQNLAPVCRRWWDLSKTPILWKEITIAKQKPFKCYRQLLLRCKLLNSLKIETPISAVCVVECIAELKPVLLKNLDLAACRLIDRKCMFVIVQNCPNIESLNIGSCDGGAAGRKGIGLEAAKAIATLKHLKSLNVRGCKAIDDNCIKTIAVECTKLEILNIDKIDSITDEAICSVARHRKGTLSQLFVSARKLTNSSMMALSVCEKLNTLCVSGKGDFTDVALKAIMPLPELDILRISYQEFQTNIWKSFFKTTYEWSGLPKNKPLEQNNGSIHDFVKNNRNLWILYFSSHSDDDLKVIIDNCSQLVHLKLTRMTLTRKTLHDIPDKLKHLQFLSLICCKGFCLRTLNSLLRKMPSLRINYVICEKNNHYSRMIKLERNFGKKHVKYAIQKLLEAR